MRGDGASARQRPPPLPPKARKRGRFSFEEVMQTFIVRKI